MATSFNLLFRPASGFRPNLRKRFHLASGSESSSQAVKYFCSVARLALGKQYL